MEYDERGAAGTSFRRSEAINLEICPDCGYPIKKKKCTGCGKKFKIGIFKLIFCKIGCHWMTSYESAFTDIVSGKLVYRAKCACGRKWLVDSKNPLGFRIERSDDNSVVVDSRPSVEPIECPGTYAAKASEYGCQADEMLRLLRENGMGNYVVSVRFINNGCEYFAENVTSKSKIKVGSCYDESSWTFDDIMDFEAWLLDK